MSPFTIAITLRPLWSLGCSKSCSKFHSCAGRLYLKLFIFFWLVIGLDSWKGALRGLTGSCGTGGLSVSQDSMRRPRHGGGRGCREHCLVGSRGGGALRKARATCEPARSLQSEVRAPGSGSEGPQCRWHCVWGWGRGEELVSSQELLCRRSQKGPQYRLHLGLPRKELASGPEQFWPLYATQPKCWPWITQGDTNWFNSPDFFFN